MVVKINTNKHNSNAKQAGKEAPQNSYLIFLRVCVSVLGVAVSFCRWMCIYFHNAAAMGTSADVIQRIFSFAVFSSSPSAASREGPGPAETTTVFIHLSNVNCLITHCSPELVCAYTHVWGCVCTCVCVLHILTLCMHLHRQLYSDPQTQWDNVHTGLRHLNHYR